MAGVVLRGVTKQFNQVTAVNEVNLEIEDKEFLVLLGPSGCGKTTTLRMVAGLEDVSHGSIVIGGQDVTDVPPKDRDIAMVFQNYALYPHMTVYENMAFGLKLHKVPKSEIDRRVNDAADILGLRDLLKRRPKELSGGQRQRVALGRAIVREPKVFLMDEPLSNLDAKLRSQMRVELKRLHQRLGATIIYVTHDQTEAMTMGTRIVVMKDGVVQQVDTPDGIYHRPANRFVATFVGTPAMNLFDADVSRTDGRVALRLGDQQWILPDGAKTAASGASRVTVGVRPEDVTVWTDDVPPGYVAVQGTVNVIEPLGHEHIVYCSVESANIVVRTPNTWAGSAGDIITLGLNAERLHLFDPESEQVLA